MGRTSARKQKEAARRRAEELLAEQAAVGTGWPSVYCAAEPPIGQIADGGLVDLWISLRLRGAVQKSNASISIVVLVRNRELLGVSAPHHPSVWADPQGMQPG